MPHPNPADLLRDIVVNHPIVFKTVEDTIYQLRDPVTAACDVVTYLDVYPAHTNEEEAWVNTVLYTFLVDTFRDYLSAMDLFEGMGADSEFSDSETEDATLEVRSDCSDYESSEVSEGSCD